jgi:hypothetical protein
MPNGWYGVPRGSAVNHQYLARVIIMANPSEGLLPLFEKKRQILVRGIYEGVGELSGQAANRWLWVES